MFPLVEAVFAVAEVTGRVYSTFIVTSRVVSWRSVEFDLQILGNGGSQKSGEVCVECEKAQMSDPGKAAVSNAR